MSFAAPWLLTALVLLPALWWLLRVTPPAAKRVVFPPTRLLLDLPRTEQTPARTPPWLLALRLAAAGLVILGLAGPMRGHLAAPERSGPLLVVIDDGWASGPDWRMRVAAADRLLAEAERQGAAAMLLPTAPAPDGAAPALLGPAPAHDIRAGLAALVPKPWPPDQAAAGRVLAALPLVPGRVAYIADGIAHAAGWGDALDRLARATPLTVLSGPRGAVLRAQATAEGWVATVSQVPSPTATPGAVRAEAADGRVLARVPLVVAAGQAEARAELRLPVELRNRVDRLSLEAPEGGTLASAAAVALLDEADRRRPVGLVAADPGLAAPLTGSGYFLQRALGPFAEWREGTTEALLARPLAVLLAADRPLPPGPEATALRDWVAAGGVLVRFAGPDMAQAAQDGQPDALLPVPLLASERQLGGTMSWGKPVPVAPFAPGSPFAGLPEAAEVAVTRQVLADPAADLGDATWARLADGTPLVTQRAIGAGRVVLFHVTANTDWSDLPLSGLFVDMLRRVVALSGGVAGEATATGELVPARTLDGFGVLGDPPQAARPWAAAHWSEAVASPLHPPGLYGPEGARRVLNLSQNLPDPHAAPAIAGATQERLEPTVPPRPFGPLLVALAALLLVADLVASLRARGLLAAAAASLLLTVLPARAEDAAQAAALATRLAYVRGDPASDTVARAGLVGLSAYVNARTAAALADPVGVVPGQDDCSVFPLLYWRLGEAVPGGGLVAALNAYMAHGGVVLIDTADGGSGAGMGAGETGQAGRGVLRRLGRGGSGSGLDVPPLAPLTGAHVLARSFYLLSEFPGRYEGDTVWVARDIDRSNDSVSPVVVGGHDWAAAWAVDDQGQHPYATLPGGERQRTLAYRFGVNIVMYALTGNYKGDQVHVPALLQRLGQ